MTTKQKRNKIADAFDIESHIIDCDVSYRGGTLKIDVSEVFPEVTDWDNGDDAIMGASQNYLGGGIAGRITSGAMFDKERLMKKQRAVYEALAERIKRYFYNINNGGGDEYMQENVTGQDAHNGYETLQRLGISAY